MCFLFTWFCHGGLYTSIFQSSHTEFIYVKGDVSSLKRSSKCVLLLKSGVFIVLSKRYFTMKTKLMKNNFEQTDCET